MKTAGKLIVLILAFLLLKTSVHALELNFDVDINRISYREYSNGTENAWSEYYFNNPFSTSLNIELSDNYSSNQTGSSGGYYYYSYQWRDLVSAGETAFTDTAMGYFDRLLNFTGDNEEDFVTYTPSTVLLKDVYNAGSYSLSYLIIETSIQKIYQVVPDFYKTFNYTLRIEGRNEILAPNGPNDVVLMDENSLMEFIYHEDTTWTFNERAIAGEQRYYTDINNNVVGQPFEVFGDSVYYFGPATLAANPVPEPATMLLLGSGLVGLAGFRRKFRKN